MKTKRWYEQNPQLKIILDTLKTLSEDVQISVANDIIQMILENENEFTDEFIEKIHAVYHPTGRRWYDKNETIQAAIEMVRHLESYKQQELLIEILYSILYFNQEKTLNNNILDD